MFFRLIALLYLFIYSSLYADITLFGYLHPGDTQNSTFTPSDPLSNDTETTYDYYTDNPTKFYLSETSDLTGIELMNAVDIDSDSNIRVYIDGDLVETGADGSATVNFSTLSLSSGYHTIAVVGSCYDRRGSEVDCTNRRVRNVDDFSFSDLLLKTGQTTAAVNFIDRVHIGDNSDDDDNYDIDDSSQSWYPDDNGGSFKEYSINISQELVGFKIFISRVRDVYADGINTIEIYDNDSNLITSFDINESSSYKFDYSESYVGNITGISRVKVISGIAGGSDYDDISFGELIVIPYISTQDIYPKPFVNYQMDECFWDGTQDDVKDSTDNANDATSGNDANTTDGKICRAGDIIATDSSDKYILAQDGISLAQEYSLTLWIKLPLNEDGHQDFSGTSFFNIADVEGSKEDYIYFAKDSDGWSLCMYGSNYECYDYNPQNLSGWHQFVFNVSDNGTDFYVDTDKKLSFSEHPNNRTLSLLFNSDYDDNDNVANGQSIGAIVDEFKIFSSSLSTSEITNIYDNENSGNNYDGSTRTCNNCNGGGSGTVDINGSYNAVDLVNGSCSAENNWDDNITTKISSRAFDLTILARDQNNSTAIESNITKVEFYIYTLEDGQNCSGDKIVQNICMNCGVTDTNGCLNLNDINISNALKCVEVHIEGQEINSTTTTDSNATDNFAIRPDHFEIQRISNDIVRAGRDFQLLFKAVDANNKSAKDYNETLHIRGSSADLEYNSLLCKTGTLNEINGSNFANGETNMTLQYSEVGDVNFSLQEVNQSEFAKVDADDTATSERFIQQANIAQAFSVYPDHFELVAHVENFNDGNFTYISQDLNMSAKLDINITAQNEQNSTTQNYNASCYAKDTNLTVAYKPKSIDGLNKLLYFETNRSLGGEIDLGDPLLINAKKEIFIAGDANGTAKMTLLLNFDRNFSMPVNPFDFNITDINITDENNTIGNINLDENVTFFYARLLPADLTTSKTTDITTVKVLVYDTNGSDPKIQNYQEELLDWYIYTIHTQNEGTLTNFVTSTTVVQPSSNEDNIVAGLDSYSNGVFTVDVNNTQQSSNTHYIHFSSKSFLWYVPAGFGNEYNDSVGSDCSSHPCFEYRYEDNNKESNSSVNSGTTTGLSFDLNTSKNSRGVRLYR